MRIESGGQSANLANANNDQAVDESAADTAHSKSAAQQNGAPDQQGEFKDSAAAAKQAAILNGTAGGSQGFSNTLDGPESAQVSADTDSATNGLNSPVASSRSGNPDEPGLVDPVDPVDPVNPVDPPYRVGQVIQMEGTGYFYEILGQRLRPHPSGEFPDQYEYHIQRVNVGDSSKPEPWRETFTKDDLPEDFSRLDEYQDDVAYEKQIVGTLRYNSETGRMVKGTMYTLDGPPVYETVGDSKFVKNTDDAMSELTYYPRLDSWGVSDYDLIRKIDPQHSTTDDLLEMFNDNISAYPDKPDNDGNDHDDGGAGASLDTGVGTGPVPEAVGDEPHPGEPDDGGGQGSGGTGGSTGNGGSGSAGGGGGGGLGTTSGPFDGPTGAPDTSNPLDNLPPYTNNNPVPGTVVTPPLPVLGGQIPIPPTPLPGPDPIAGGGGGGGNGPDEPDGPNNPDPIFEEADGD